MDLSEFLAGIMQSVNSTLGTLNFKPLDKIIKNMFAEINHVSKTGIGAVIYQNNNQTSCGTITSPRVFAKFIAPVSGIYKITGNFWKTGVNSSDTTNCFVYKISEKEDYFASVFIEGTTISVSDDKSVKLTSFSVNNSTNDILRTLYLYAKKDEIVMLTVVSENVTNEHLCKNIEITYEPFVEE